jgi:trans-aconitate 2-methyltransferase
MLARANLRPMPPADYDPAQYARFAAERRAPFDDLLALVRPAPGGRVVDLGCGPGPLTRELHDKADAAATLGVDASPAMLAKAAAHAGGGVSFEAADIAEFCLRPGLAFDVVFSNAALHWLPDLADAIATAAAIVAPGGQLAVQVPQNFEHPSHVTATDVAREPRFANALGGHVRPPAMIAPEAVAALLFELGFVAQRVRLEVYAHRLAHRRDVVEWVKGTLLIDYEKRLSPGDFADFVARYEELLVPRLGDRDPYLFPFKRLLLWAKRGP